MSKRNLPIQKLLFYVVQDIDEKLVADVAGFVAELGSAREWCIEPPTFVNEGEGLVRTLGGYLNVYSALSPIELEPSLDRQNLEDTKFLVKQIQEFSGRRDVNFEFELDGRFVGSVDAGKSDRTVDLGLLQEWERVLLKRGG